MQSTTRRLRKSLRMQNGNALCTSVHSCTKHQCAVQHYYCVVRIRRPFFPPPNSNSPSTSGTRQTCTPHSLNEANHHGSALPKSVYEPREDRVLALDKPLAPGHVYPNCAPMPVNDGRLSCYRITQVQACTRFYIKYQKITIDIPAVHQLTAPAPEASSR